MTGSTWSQRPCPPASAYQHGRQTQKCRLFSSHLSRNYGLLEYDAVCFRIRVTKFRTNLTASHIQATRAKADGRKAIGNVGLGLKLHGVICRTTAILTLTALNASHRTTKSRTLKKKYLRGEVQLHAFLRANPDTTEVPLSHPSSFTMGGREGGERARGNHGSLRCSGEKKHLLSPARNRAPIPWPYNQRRSNYAN